MTNFTLCFTILVLILLTSCTNTDKNSINKVIDKRIESLELKDINLYSDCIVNDYVSISEDNVIDRDSLLENFRINTSFFDKIKFINSEREIFIKGDTAKVIIDTSIELKIKDKFSRYKTKEQINLIKKDGNWKINKESNLDLLKGFVFGEKSV